MSKVFWFLLSIAVVLIDQLSKYLAESWLVLYKPVPVFPMFNVTLAYNTGAAFSMLSSVGSWHQLFFASVSVVASIVLIIWLYRTDRQQKLQSLSLSLILGGAAGNLIDRVFQGYVVDFIDVYYKNHHFATFNIADSAICIGGALLVLDMLKTKY